MTAGEGERLEAARRRKFWGLMIALAVLGAVSGFLVGVAGGYADAVGAPVSSTMRMTTAAAIIVGVAAAAFFSWRFFRIVDEVELADNLWGSLIGFYVYAFLFPTWWMLHWLRIAPEPNDWAIFTAALVSAAAVYGYRKLANSNL